MAEEFKVLKLEEVKEDMRKLSIEVPPEVVVATTKKLGLDVFRGVIKRTPVDTGRARGGWMVGINAPNDESTSSPEAGATPGSPQGTALQRGITVLAKATPFCEVFITNNVTYIVVLDQGLFIPPDPGPSKQKRKKNKSGNYRGVRKEGKVLVQGGFSTQAPAGMVDVTLAEVLGDRP